jgi:hypothetical protein
MIKPTSLIVFSAAAILLSLPAAGQNSFYKEAPLFSTAPSVVASVNELTRFGPVGLALELHQPAFTLVAGTIEPGSPAEAAGLKKGQIIESINGQKLKDIDPRIQLGNLITEAEATDGILKFAIQGESAPVVVKIPVLGRYSKTWPLNCPKSDKIVRNFAEYLKKPGANKGFADIGMLFLLSTGDDADLATVRDWVHSLKGKKNNGYAWHIGYGGLALCEYYLRTGDTEAIPIIQQWVEAAAKGEYLDAWAGRGGVVKLGYGQGHLNAGGTHVITFLLLAKQCGANVPDSLLHRTLTHFFRYAGRGSNPYGDDRPETSFVDNGKNGKLAFAMAAAASLTPDGEKSIYAKARDQMANTSFYTTTFMLHGHTGGGIGEIWRSGAMNLLTEKKPKQTREFMDHRMWHYEMSRRFDGSFAILGGAGYDKIEWGAAYALTYTIPRKTLSLTGAPPSKFSKPYALPARPWGTEADDIFVSLDPVPGSDLDVSTETLTKHSSLPLIRSLNEKELTDDEIRRYLHHPDYLVRHMVSMNAAGLTCDYMNPKPGPRVRPHLLEEFCTHSDPRIRNAGFRASVKAFDPATDWSKTLFAIAIERLKDDKESWFVKDACLSLVQCATPDMIAPHADLLVSYLTHKEQWLQQGSAMALTNVATDARCYEKVIPALGALLQSTPRQSTTGGVISKLQEIMPTATGKPHDLALKVFGQSYLKYSGPETWEGGQNLAGHKKETLERLAATLASTPGGYDVLYQMAKERNPHEPLPYSEIFLAADPEKFGSDLRNAIKPIIRDELIYQYVGQNRRKIFAELEQPSQRGSVTNTIDGLVALYQKVGVHEYDWKPFGPDLKNTVWNYFSFDPPETQKYDMSPWRYRTVTYPKGMENWFAKDFDPARAGWKKGPFPIGQYKGKLTDNDTRSPWNEIPRTLWEKEVLLVHGSFEFPALKPGHEYRLRVQRGQGVGAGDGFKIFINGKALVENKAGLGRREGDTIRGGWITKDFTPEFGKGPITFSAITFLRYGDRAIVQMPPVPQGIFSMWLEERKTPPLDKDVLRKAASFLPMLTSDWQALQDPQSDEGTGTEGLFRYDGKVTPNPKLTGTWTTVALVNSPDEFDPAAKPDPGKSPIKKITFLDDGTTDSPDHIWSGTTLMDLNQSQALKITSKTLGASEFLFIEAGGFNAKNPVGWKPQLMVLKKAKP